MEDAPRLARLIHPTQHHAPAEKTTLKIKTKIKGDKQMSTKTKKIIIPIITSIIIVLLGYLFISYKQPKTKISKKQDGTTVITNYNKNNKKITEATYREDESISWITYYDPETENTIKTHTYATNGTITQDTEFNPKTEKLTKHTFYYDNGHIKNSTEYNNITGKKMIYNAYFYNGTLNIHEQWNHKTGNPIKSITFHHNGSSAELNEYDDNGDDILTLHYNENNQLESKNEYNPQTKQRTKTIYNPDGSIKEIINR